MGTTKAFANGKELVYSNQIENIAQLNTAVINISDYNSSLNVGSNTKYAIVTVYRSNLCFGTVIIFQGSDIMIDDRFRQVEFYVKLQGPTLSIEVNAVNSLNYVHCLFG